MEMICRWAPWNFSVCMWWTIEVMLCCHVALHSWASYRGSLILTMAITYVFSHVGAMFSFQNTIKCKWNRTDFKSPWGTATRGLVTLHPQFVSQKGSPIYIPWKECLPWTFPLFVGKYVRGTTGQQSLLLMRPLIIPFVSCCRAAPLKLSQE